MNFENLEQEFAYYVRLALLQEAFTDLLFSQTTRTRMSDEKNKFAIAKFESNLSVSLEMKDLAQKVFSNLTTAGTGVLKRVGEILDTQIKCFKAERTAKAFARCHEILAPLGIEAQAIDLKSLMPIIEGLSLESETETVAQAMWENLLLTAIVYGRVHPSWIGIMKQLGPLDAKVLDAFWKTAVVPNTEEGGMHNGSHYKRYPPEILAIKKQTNGAKIREFLQSENGGKVDRDAITEAITILGSDGIIDIIGYSGNEENWLKLTLKGGRFMRAVTGEIS
jgi:Abortive infection alpha